MEGNSGRKPDITDPFISRKIVLLGRAGVGKSSICGGFLERNFSEEYHPTYEDFLFGRISHRSQTYQLTLVDTQGQEDPGALRGEYCVGADGYILVFDVTKPETLHSLREINNFLQHHCVNDVGRIIVANKIDLKERLVSRSEGRNFANELGCNYVECSTKNNRNIKKCFHILLDDVEQYSQNNCNFWSCIESMTTNRCPDLSWCFDYLDCNPKSVTLFGVILTMIQSLIQLISSFLIATNVETDDGLLFAFVIGGLGIILCFSSILAVVGILHPRHNKYLLFYMVVLVICSLLQLCLTVPYILGLSFVRKNLYLTFSIDSITFSIQLFSFLAALYYTKYSWASQATNHERFLTVRRTNMNLTP